MAPSTAETLGKPTASTAVAPEGASNLPTREASIKVPDPKKFGGRSDQVRRFKTALLIQIAGSLRHFSNNGAKTMYMARLLVDTAEVWF